MLLGRLVPSWVPANDRYRTAARVHRCARAHPSLREPALPVLRRAASCRRSRGRWCCNGALLACAVLATRAAKGPRKNRPSSRAPECTPVVAATIATTAATMASSQATPVTSGSADRAQCTSNHGDEGILGPDGDGGHAGLACRRQPGDEKPVGCDLEQVRFGVRRAAPAPTSTAMIGSSSGNRNTNPASRTTPIVASTRPVGPGVDRLRRGRRRPWLGHDPAP